jgi:nucleolar GTP-binding protein
MSTLTEQGVMDVKGTACERLLAYRVEAKLAGKRIGDVLNRMHVAIPKATGAASVRPPVIPASVVTARAAAAANKQQPVVGAAKLTGRKTEKQLQEEGGGAGVHVAQGLGWA